MTFQERVLADRPAFDRNELAYFPAVDGLRALAVLSVLFYHLHSGLLPGGLVGVDIFFVISGFVVTGSLLRMPQLPLSSFLLHFYARRIQRIMPALLAVLFVTTLAYCLFIPSAWLNHSIQTTGQGAAFGVSNIVMAANGDTYFSPDASQNPFTHTWSLGVEEQFYLIFPFLMAWWRKGDAAGARQRTILAAIIALSLLSLAACAVLTELSWRYAFYSTPSRFWELGVGMVLCLTLPFWRDRVSNAGAALLGPLGIALIGIGFALSGEQHFPFPNVLLPVVGAAAIIAVIVARPHSSIGRVFATRGPVAVGRMSYSIYLWHWPVIVFFRWTVGLDSPEAMVAAFGLSILLGWASYALIELPTRRSRPFSVASRGRFVAAGFGVIVLAFLVNLGLVAAKPFLSLSRTAASADWYAGKGDKHVGPAALHPVTLEDAPLLGGKVRRWKPVAPKEKSAERQLFVVGDSHSLTYYPALRRFAEDTGYTTSAYFVGGCTFLSLRRQVRDEPTCDGKFYEAAVQDILTRGRPGDILFLPNLRLLRFVDQSGPTVPDPMAPPLPPDARERAFRARATAEAIGILRPVAQKGIRVVFESPTPLFRATPMRCSDWFNRSNSLCAPGFTVAREDMDIMRKTTLEQMGEIGAAMPNIYVWNAFDLLCPGPTCNAFLGSRPLFMDGDHLSNYGQERLYPHLKGFLQSVLNDTAKTFHFERGQELSR